VIKKKKKSEVVVLKILWIFVLVEMKWSFHSHCHNQGRCEQVNLLDLLSLLMWHMISGMAMM